MSRPLQVRKTWLDPVQADLMVRVVESLGRGDQAAVVESWSRLIEHLVKASSLTDESDINDLIWQTMWEAGLGSDIAGATSPESLENAIKGWEEKLNSVGDDAQLANVDLQNMLQKQQQLLQMVSTIAKMLYDTAMAVIRKIGG